MSNKKSSYRFATIGRSNITEKFLAAAKDCTRFKHTAVYSRSMADAKDFAKMHRVEQVYDSISEMAGDPTIDAVYIASPNALHFEQAKAMLIAGKHVLCEKSLTSNEEEAKHLIELAKEKSVVILEATRNLHDPMMAELERNMEKLGRIRRVQFQFCKYSSRYDRFLKGEEVNIFSTKLSSGALTDIGIYCIEPLIYLFGMPKKLHASSILLRNGADGAGSILAEYDGMTAELIYSKITSSRLFSQIQGEKGTMYIDEIAEPKKLVIEMTNGESVTISGAEQAKMELAGGSNMLFELEHFLDMIEGKEAADRYHETTLSSIKMMDEIREQTGIVFCGEKHKKAFRRELNESGESINGQR